MGPTRRCRSTYSRQREPEPEPELATGEPEPSERQRRATGIAGDDLGSSRSSRDDDVPPQMYDEGGPHASEEADLHASEERAGGLTSSTASIPYKRGPSQLTKRPIPVDRRPLIAPQGDR
jgi:hypothetical protein